jgi:hypothetical protein
VGSHRILRHIFETRFAASAARDVPPTWSNSSLAPTYILLSPGEPWRQHDRRGPDGCGPRPLLFVNCDTSQYHRTSERSNLLPGGWMRKYCLERTCELVSCLLRVRGSEETVMVVSGGKGGSKPGGTRCKNFTANVLSPTFVQTPWPLPKVGS